MKVVLNGNKAQAMMDTGATYNFIADRVVGTLGLQVTQYNSKIKAVNSMATPIRWMAIDVVVQVGTWKGKANFMVVPLDDF